ncbi:hypothetical protein BGX26_010620, partial [Mortierella sp. AD094]
MTTDYPPCPSLSSPCPISTVGPAPTLADKSSSKINKGLVVGLVLALTLLVLLISFCILRRRKQGVPFFFGINRKGSRISLSRGGSGSSSHGGGVGQGASDIGNAENGYGHAAASRTDSNAVAGVVLAEKSLEDGAQNLARGPTPTETAEAVARGQMNTGESAGTTSTRVAAAAAAATAAHLRHHPTVTSAIADVGSGSMANPGMTLVDIPELPEPQHSEALSGNRQDAVYSIDAASGVNDRQPSHQNPADSLTAKSVEALPLVTAVDSKNSRLHRAVSAASIKLGLQSTRPPPHLTQDPRQSHQLQRAGSSGSLSSGFLCNNFLFRSDSKIPSTSNRGVITTIRPEHHQQQMRQLQLEQDLEVGNQGDQPSPREQTYPTFGRQSGIGLISSNDAFTNPGPPPPLPSSARSRSKNAKSGTANQKRGYSQPIYIRAQLDGASPAAQEHAAKSEAHNPGLYGY